jgi:hypothetical protein
MLFIHCRSWDVGNSQGEDKRDVLDQMLKVMVAVIVSLLEGARLCQ